MFIVWVTTQVVVGKRDRFLAAIAQNAAASVRDEPGCFTFDVIELDATEGRYAFYEVYRDRDAFEVEHRAAAHYASWKAAMEDCVVLSAHHNTVGSRIISIHAQQDS